MQPIIYTDTNYWEPLAINVQDHWVQKVIPDALIAHKDNLYAEGASKRLHRPLIKYTGKNFLFNEKKVTIPPSYKEIVVESVPVKNKPILCVDTLNELFSSALGLVFNHGYPIMALGANPWNTFFHLGVFKPDDLYGIISCSRMVLTADQDLMVNCWGLGIPATNIVKPKDLLDFVNGPMAIPDFKLREVTFKQVLSLLK